MVRRYRRSYRHNRDKYSIENTTGFTPGLGSWPVIPAGENTIESKQYSFQIVSATDIEGTRKVKHITLSFSFQGDSRILFALVYVPSGYQPNSINYPDFGESVSLYEPSQYVMASGVLDFTGGPLRIKTPLSRNLNAGDSIALVLANNSSDQEVAALTFNASYAITLQ